MKRLEKVTSPTDWVMFSLGKGIVLTSHNIALKDYKARRFVMKSALLIGAMAIGILPLQDATASKQSLTKGATVNGKKIGERLWKGTKQIGRDYAEDVQALARDAKASVVGNTHRFGSGIKQGALQLKRNPKETLKAFGKWGKRNKYTLGGLAAFYVGHSLMGRPVFADEDTAKDFGELLMKIPESLAGVTSEGLEFASDASDVGSEAADDGRSFLHDLRNDWFDD